MTLLNPHILQAKSYSAIVDRYAFQRLKSGLYEGPVNEADYVVSQRGAGANMSVDVAAGSCWVQGDDTARQGFYGLVNDAVINVAVTAAHATLPRIDRVVARIYDSSVLGSSDTPTIEVIAGTATSGAQCTDPEAANYEAGIAALPNGALHLANIQVDAAVTSIVTAKIWDKRVRRRGKSIIAASEARTNTAYGLLTTPDRIRNLAVPTDGWIAVGFQGTWQESVAAAGRAAIFLGANQVKISGHQSGAPLVQEARTQAGSGSINNTLCTNAIGLVSSNVQTYTGDVTTGQILGLWSNLQQVADTQAGGGPCYIFVAAGTYDISVRFKGSSGSVTAVNRKLWAYVVDPDQVSF